MKFSLTNVVAGVLLICLGYSFREPGETVVITRVDTIPYAAFRDSLESQRLEADGLRAKLAGRGVVQPRTILRTDTLVLPPDTVLSLLKSDGRTLTIAPLIKGSDSLWTPEIHSFDVGKCDDGFSWASGELVCDRARLGHFGPAVRLEAHADPFRRTTPIARATVGVEWIPSYRSGWRSFLGMGQDGSVVVSVSRRWLMW